LPGVPGAAKAETRTHLQALGFFIAFCLVVDAVLAFRAFQT
jgi:hypothetical protein